MSHRSGRMPLAQAELTEPEPRYFQFGRFAISTTIAPYGQGQTRHPAGITLAFRVGDDRTHHGYDLTWAEVEALHAQLGDAVMARKKFAEAVRDAKARKR